MEAYYKEQKIIAPEKWDAFLAAARTNLPTTFRISPVVAFADEMKKKLRSHFADLKIDELAKEMQEDDERLKAPEPIAWYPDELAWGMSISKKALKKTPALEKFHKYLVAETETGNITRQEAVSMIPPLFMDVEPHHRVLDMCAAPGSKTSQCLEFLHAKCGSTGVPAGVVIANDADLERCSMLTHQMKRINSPSLVVLHHEAQNIPMLWQKSGEGASLTRTPMRYDRVLADVPCSGDGTMRKNVDVWRKWSPSQGLGLHKTQLMILARAVELCEVGGVVVYSTCSMNPIENEAVVGAALARFRHCLELEDTSKVCPSLIRHAGLHTWRVRDRKDQDVWYTPEDLPPNLKQVYPSTIFPPSATDAAELHLERCVRIYPHDQDTGGFFICKLRKTADHMPTKREAPPDAAPAPEAAKTEAAAAAAPAAAVAPAADVKVEEKTEKTDVKMETVGAEAAVGEKRKAEGEADAGEPKKEEQKTGEKKDNKKQKKSQYDILIPISQASLVERLCEFYGLGPGFPSDQLFTSSDTGNKIYFVSAAVRQLLAADGKGQLHTVHAGVKMFEKNPTKNETFDYRLRQEGVAYLLPWLTKRIVKLDLADFSVLLTKRCMLFSDLKTEGASQAVADMGGGCMLFMLKSDEWTGSNSVYLAGWRGTQQLTLFVSKLEAQALSHKVLGTKKEEDKKEDGVVEAVASAPEAVASAPALSEPKSEIPTETKKEATETKPEGANEVLEAS